MKTDIYLLHYNNYFNRTVKKAGDLILNYVQDLSLGIDFVRFENTNFVPGDGVLTSLVLGTGDKLSLLADLDISTFDYLLVAEHFDDATEANNAPVISRWFIMECDRTRLNQYIVGLRRDVLVDNLSAVVDAPVYIEKATIKDVNNPLLFNSENLSVNQIKQAEYPIKDETQSGWVVGYVPRDSFSEQTPVDSDVFLAAPADIEVSGISSWPFWKNVLGLNPNGEYLIGNNGINEIRFRNKSRYGRTAYSTGTNTYFAKRYVYFETGTELNDQNAFVRNIQTGSVSGAPAQGNLASWYEGWTGQEYMAYTAPTAASEVGFFGTSAVPTLVGNIYNNTIFKDYIAIFLHSQAGIEVGETAGLRALDTKIIKDTSTNIYYRINVKSRTETDYIPVTTSISIGTNIINFINNNLTRTGLTPWSYTFTGNLSSGEIELRPTATEYWIELEQLALSLRVNIDNQRAHLEDAQYDMFCIPYSDSLKLYDGTDTFTCNKSVALTMATAIGAKTGTGNLYDIQLLPYCPCREAVLKSEDPSDTLNISGISHDVITAYDSSNSTYGAKYSAIIWCSRSTFDLERSVEDIDALTNLAGPYKAISYDVPQSKTYYALTNLYQKTGESSYRFGLTTQDSNLIKVAKVDKNTGYIIDIKDYNTIEVRWTDTTTTLNIYTYNNHSNPEISLSLNQYNNASYIFAIYINTDAFGGQSIVEEFKTLFTVPTMYYFNALLDNAEDIKISNECDLYRLVSGNYNGIFEFSLAKSGGINGVKIECTYKP